MCKLFKECKDWEAGDKQATELYFY
jgi:hypothetical protein